VTLCGWKGNNSRSGVALAMRHGLSGLSTYGLNGHDREMSTLRKPYWGTADNGRVRDTFTHKQAKGADDQAL